MLAAPGGQNSAGTRLERQCALEAAGRVASTERPAGASKKRKIPGARSGREPPDSINQTLKKTRKKRVDFSAEVQCYAFGIGLAAQNRSERIQVVSSIFSGNVLWQ
jgi:hypothetical protein